MSDSLIFLDALIDVIQRAGHYNRNDQAPPAAVLWPDKECQWLPLLPRLRPTLPLLTYGPYLPEQRSGPAYWLRCMIAHTLPEDVLSVEQTPIIYLPGVSRQEIRAVEECPKALQPLAELQYRGVLWTQKNGRDWSIAAFLQAREGGLGIDVSTDSATREALQRALLRLADEPLSNLRKAAPLRAAYLDALLNPDEARSLLLWLNDPAGYPVQVSQEAWISFGNLCIQKYHFHPEKDGVITAARLLAEQKGQWNLIWERYCESPYSYPNIPERLRNARPTQLSLFEGSGSYPQDNDAAERRLREQLKVFDRFTPEQARAQIYELEQQHSSRRLGVWVRLNQAPLALALEALTRLADGTKSHLTATSLPDLIVNYSESGWKADAAVMQSLATVRLAEDVAVVKIATRALYRSWLEAAASTFQQLAAMPGNYSTSALPIPIPGTCLLFSDALRMDAGQQLSAGLQALGYSVDIKPRLVALPSITPTAKPALLQVSTELTGERGLTLTPVLRGSQTPLTAAAFRTLIAEAGGQVLTEDETGNPRGWAWTELGSIDSYGHQHGWKLAHHLADELDILKNRVISLLDQGWEQVIVVTDHGWQLLPGDLPKAELPEQLTVLRKGRCARLKDFARTDSQIVPWFWDPEVPVAMAPGICCYEAGKEYEHGGLSPQECIVPIITVFRSKTAHMPTVIIDKVTWKGLRCHVKLTGATPDFLVDIRSKAGDASTSVIVTPKPPDVDGNISIVVDNEDLQGQAVIIVVVDTIGQLCAQQLTTIGG